MYFEDKYDRQYDIPKLPQNSDYSFNGDVYCDCKDRDGIKYLHWSFDGLYENKHGLYGCFTCNKCGAKFSWHFPEDEDRQRLELTSLSSLHFLDRYKYTIHDYDYKVIALYSGGETNTLKITIERNELNLSLLKSNFSGVFEQQDMKEFPFRLDNFKQRTYDKIVSMDDYQANNHINNIGAFYFTFYFLKNTAASHSSQKYPYNEFDTTNRKRWLKKFGGIRIYNEESRVRPYGESGNDWLGLGERQRQSPYGVGQKKGGFRIKPNQIAGAVYMSKSKNLFYKDKFGHEGMQENEEFNLLKSLLLRIIEEFENDRNTIMYNLSQLHKATKFIESKTIVVSTTANTIKEQENKNKKGSNSEKTLDKILTGGNTNHEVPSDKKENVQMLLIGLASIGIFLTSFAHELKGLSYRLLLRTSSLKVQLQSLIPSEKLVGLDPYDNPFYRLELIQEDDQKLQDWIKYSLNSIRRDKREMKLVSLYEYFKAFDQLWNEWLQHKSIFLNINEISKELFVQAVEMDLDSIFYNLVANSVYSLLRTNVKRKEINVSVYHNHDFVVIEFVDNGKGLDRDYKNNPSIIFNALETSHKDMFGNRISTGMGLYIAKYVVDSYSDASIGIMPTEVGFGIKVSFKLNT